MTCFTALMFMVFKNNYPKVWIGWKFCHYVLIYLPLAEYVLTRHTGDAE